MEGVFFEWLLMDIKNMGREALVEWLARHGARAFRADQILKWLYIRLADRFDQMTDLSKSLRDCWPSISPSGACPPTRC
jgi:adenine C2-methylase RlmN of 23S rRNA A2503 and tRNA A37